MPGLDPQLFEFQKDLWEDYDEDDAEAPWRGLTGGTRARHLRFSNYANILMEDLSCDAESCKKFMFLAEYKPPLGFMECTKILTHMVKDKSKDPADDEPWSNWLLSACREAISAIDAGPDLHWQCFEKFKSANKGKGKDYPGTWVPYWKGKGKGHLVKCGTWDCEDTWWAPSKGTWPQEGKGGSSSSSSAVPAQAPAQPPPEPADAPAKKPNPWDGFQAKREEGKYHRGLR